MNPTYKKAVLGGLVSLVVLTVCVVVLTQIKSMPPMRHANLSLGVLLLFFIAVGAIYAISIFMWRNFYSLFGESRNVREAFIDMGLIAIGKYLPGKVWGILSRGAVDNDGVSLKSNRVAISAAEQGYVLFVGLSMVGFLLLSNFAEFTTGMTLLLALVTIALCTLGLRVVLMLLSAASKRLGSVQAVVIDRPGLFRSMGLALGYLLLWGLTAIPILILILGKETLGMQQLMSIAAAFLSSMIAGWLAIFAPGGIGIRESAFVYLAPEFFTWQSGLFWITLHRALFTVFDLLYGGATLLLIVYRTKLLKQR